MTSLRHKPVFVKRVIAIFLLAVFTLGITPKKTLHSLLANHTDSTFKANDGKLQQLSKAGFNCQCDNLVAESNFIAGIDLIIISPAVSHAHFTSYYTSFFSLPHLLFNLRGPPMNV